jgi:hypothetical protein
MDLTLTRFNLLDSFTPNSLAIHFNIILLRTIIFLWRQLAEVDPIVGVVRSEYLDTSLW